MKTLMTSMGLATALGFAFIAGPIRAQDVTADTAPTDAPAVAPGDSSASFQTFYDQLSNQGTWVQTDKYGYVFQPTENNPNWRPYTYGHWVNTDAGMTWISNDSFGWATDHYGRWTNIDGYGWVWVPGTTWAPAWVSWRQSDDYYGWAPLPPETAVGVDYEDPGVSVGLGFHIGDDCDVSFGIGAGWYNFCPVAYIGDNDCWRHYADHRDNYTIINRTTNITNINITNNHNAGTFGRVHEGGPSLARLNEHARTPIHQARLESAHDAREAGLHGNRLAAFAPRIDSGTIKTARPHEVSGTLANAKVNRGANINHPLVATHGAKTEAPTAAQVHAATVAEANAPAHARIAHANTAPTHPLNHSLTSLRPNAGNTTTHAAVASHAGETSHHAAAAAGEESAYTGAPATHREASHESPVASTYHAQAGTAVNHPATPVYHPQVATAEHHTSAQAYHPQAAASVVHHRAPTYHPQVSAPVVHHATPAYHPQASFHPAAHVTQPHFSGGAHSAPAVHASAGKGEKKK